VNNLTSLLNSKASLSLSGASTASNGRAIGNLRSVPLLDSLFINTPYWQSINNIRALFDWFHSNPIFYSTVMIKAREYANMRIRVVNRNTGEAEPESSGKRIPKLLYQRFNSPNVMQSRWEFFKQRKIYEEVCGNSFTYGNFTLGTSKGSIENLAALWNVWPAYMKFKLGGRYFEATEKSDVVAGWKFELGSYKKEWQAFEIMHKNTPNTTPHKGLIFGVAVAETLVKPLTNIDLAYESRNVMMQNRGMRAIISSNKTDATGNLTLDEHEIKILQKRIEDYGLLKHQSPFFFSDMPVNV
jgi:hypothetical protein